METLGSLIDKLTIVKLKQFHTEFNNVRFSSLELQEESLINEIDEYVLENDARVIPANKVCDIKVKVFGTIGGLISSLAITNCKIWHLQEKIYDFESVKPDAKDAVIGSIARLNIKRTALIEEIDKEFSCIKI
jgi:hypothetical protein